MPDAGRPSFCLLPPRYTAGMDVAALATSLVTMSLARTQASASIAVLRQQFEMQRSVIGLLAGPPARDPAPAGQGRLVDRIA